MAKAGVDPEAADAAIQKLNATIGEFVEGTDEAEKKFKKLGLSFQDIAGKSTIEVYGEIADKIKNAKVGSGAGGYRC